MGGFGQLLVERDKSHEEQRYRKYGDIETLVPLFVADRCRHRLVRRNDLKPYPWIPPLELHDIGIVVSNFIDVKLSTLVSTFLVQLLNPFNAVTAVNSVHVLFIVIYSKAFEMIDINLYEFHVALEVILSAQQFFLVQLLLFHCQYRVETYHGIVRATFKGGAVEAIVFRHCLRASFALEEAKN